MEAHVSSNNPLLPFAKLVLGVSARVQVIFAVCMFFPDLWHSLFWPPPLPQVPDVVREFNAVNYLGTAIAAAYALYQGTWAGAQVYFAFSFPYNTMAIIVALIAAITNGIPLIMWLYVLLAVLYLLVVAFVWGNSRVELVRELDKGGLHRQTLVQHARPHVPGGADNDHSHGALLPARTTGVTLRGR